MLSLESINYEQLAQNLTKPGIKNCAKRNHNYLEMRELIKVSRLTNLYKFEVLQENIDHNNSKTTEESYSS